MNAAPAREQFCPHCQRSYDPDTSQCPDDGTPLIAIAEPVDALLGKELDGRFRLEERLGAGGMGVVYRASQSSLPGPRLAAQGRATVNRHVAVKVLRARGDHQRAHVRRFFREAKLASRLQSPHTVGVFDFGQSSDGMLYLVMELVPGRPLSVVGRAEGPFSVERMGKVALQLCDALEVAHRSSILHRDLKPSNVMLLDGDVVKVLDFGLAKSMVDEESTVTATDQVVGTAGYLAPEVLAGAAGDERADLFALGVLLYWLLALKLPIDAKAYRWQPPAPLPPSVPPVVGNVIMRLLSEKPTSRYPSAALAREAMRAALGQPPFGPRRRARRPLLAALGALVVAGGVGATLRLRARSRIAPPPVAVAPPSPPVKTEPPPPIAPAPTVTTTVTPAAAPAKARHRSHAHAAPPATTVTRGATPAAPPRPAPAKAAEDFIPP